MWILLFFDYFSPPRASLQSLPRYMLAYVAGNHSLLYSQILPFQHYPWFNGM